MGCCAVGEFDAHSFSQISLYYKSDHTYVFTEVGYILFVLFYFSAQNFTSTQLVYSLKKERHTVRSYQPPYMSHCDKQPQGA